VGAAGRYIGELGARAHRESYVLLSHNERHEVVMAARIDKIIDAPGKPGRKIIEGELLPGDHPVHQAYVGQPTPDSARVRNPATYFDSTVGGWLCGCGCGKEIFAGEFVRGHEQTALRQRVAQIGTIPEFLRWFDAVRAGAEPAASATAPAPVSRTGQFDLSIGEDGEDGERHQLLFTTTTGQPIEPRNLKRSFDARCKKAGVRQIKIHDTRRTCGSLLASLDVHPRVAMAILRHSRIALTMEVYTQVPDKTTRDALKRLSDWLDRPGGEAAS